VTKKKEEKTIPAILPDRGGKKQGRKGERPGGRYSDLFFSQKRKRPRLPREGGKRKKIKIKEGESITTQRLRKKGAQASH